MKTESRIPLGMTCGIALALLSTAPAFGAEFVWTGAVDNDYLTDGNWNLTGVPNTGSTAGNQPGVDNVTIGGSSVYTPGGDYVLGRDSTITITNGGSWEQVGGISWLQARGATLNIETGGSFNTGTAQNMTFEGGEGTTINVGGDFIWGSTGLQGGTAELTASSFNITTGGLMTHDGNFNWNRTDFSINGGTLEVNRLQAGVADFVQVITLNAGSIIINNGNTNQGFGSTGGDDYINFTSLAGSVFINNINEAGATSLLDSRIRFNGVANADNFNFDAQDGGYLITAIPEPGTLVLLGIAFGTLMVFRRRS
jgi:hypothetical protein